MDTHTALDTYLDFLDTSTTTTDKEVPPVLPTPRIDSALHHYRQQTRPSPHQGVDYQSRLMHLEGQLAALLCKTKVRGHHAPAVTSSQGEGSPAPQLHKAARIQGSSLCTDSDSDSPASTAPQHRGTPPNRTGGSRPDKSRNKARRQKQHPNHGSRSSVAVGGSGVSSYEHRGSRTGSSGAAPLTGCVGVSSLREDRKRKMELQVGSGRKDEEKVEKQATADELEQERERRGKAELAAGRLVEHVRSLQAQVAETQRMYELAVVRAAETEEQLRREKEDSTEVQVRAQQLGGDLSVCRCNLEEVRGREEEGRRVLVELEKAHRQLEIEGARERLELANQVKESREEGAANCREVDLLKKGLRQVKQQLQQTQGLLATRERAHQKELERCRPLTEQELQAIVSGEVECERVRGEGVRAALMERVKEREKAYHELEEEFRTALRLEAGRYQELQESYKSVCEEVEVCRQTAVSAVQREQRVTDMVAELTAIVREQKGRISELTRGKGETLEELKGRNRELEGIAAEKARLEVKGHTLQEETARLSAQVSAQQSVIEGLREERKLWGKELAVQGATLAQDHGRLEAQVEALTQEVCALKEKWQRDRDALRIKEKQVEDQVQSIQQLRQTQSSREREEQSRMMEWERKQQELQLQLEQEGEANTDLQDQVDALVERKEQLKQELQTAEEAIDQWKSRYSKLKGQWDERVVVIGSLEQNMADLQRTLSEREASVMAERDQAQQRARSVEERLRSCDNAFREQLEAQQKSHDVHMIHLKGQKESEIAQANERVVAVESEMRELLSEMARDKRAKDEKIQRLSRAFQELQHDIT